MNNDRQLVKSFLNTLGIGFSEWEERDINIVHCSACEHNKVNGSSGDFIEFEFDKNDKLLEVSIWG